MNACVSFACPFYTSMFVVNMTPQPLYIFNTGSILPLPLGNLMSFSEHVIQNSYYY